MASAVVVAAIVCGIASQYGPGVMQQVVHNRQAMRQLPATLPDVRGFVAVVDCGRVGEVLIVDGEPMLVADCSGSAATTAWMLRNNVVVEVDYETAARKESVGRGFRVCVGGEPLQSIRRGTGSKRIIAY